MTRLARVGEEVGEGVAVGDAGPVVLGVGLECRVEGEGGWEGFRGRSNRESSNSGMVGIGTGGCGSREIQAMP